MAQDFPSTLISKFSVSLQGNQQLSRYGSLFRLSNEGGQRYIETPNRMVIKTSNQDTLYTVEPGYENRLDLISYNFYSTPHLWWAIAVANGIENPMFIDVGTILRIPSLDNIVL